MRAVEPTAADTEALANALTTATRLALGLGEVERATQHPDGRRETDTTHTLALVYCLIHVAAYLDAQGAAVNVGLLLAIAAVHDLPECYAGDVNTARGLTSEQREAKRRREGQARERLRAEDRELTRLIDIYEAQDTIEARIVHYLDKAMPRITHTLDGGAAYVESLGLGPDDLRRRHRSQSAALASGHGIPVLARLLDVLAQRSEAVIARRAGRS